MGWKKGKPLVAYKKNAHIKIASGDTPTYPLLIHSVPRILHQEEEEVARFDEAWENICR